METVNKEQKNSIREWKMLNPDFSTKQFLHPREQHDM